MDYMARKFHPDSKKLVCEIDGQDVSSSLYEDLHNIKERLKKVHALHIEHNNREDPYEDTLLDPHYIDEYSVMDTEELEEEEEEEGPSRSRKKTH